MNNIPIQLSDTTCKLVPKLPDLYDITDEDQASAADLVAVYGYHRLPGGDYLYAIVVDWLDGHFFALLRASTPPEQLADMQKHHTVCIDCLPGKEEYFLPNIAQGYRELVGDFRAL